MTAKPLPSSFIAYETAKKRIDLYRSNAHDMLSKKLSETEGVPVQETKSVWYSAKQLLEWIDEIIHYGGDGIRIYLGQKEPLEPGVLYNEKLKEPRPGQLCLIIVPTKAGAFEDSHINIIYNENSQDFRDRKAATNITSIGRSLNLGSYCPPLCPLSGEEFFE
jgi:hypothetical protein